MYMYVCMHACIYACMCVYMYVCVCRYVCMYLFIYLQDLPYKAVFTDLVRCHETGERNEEEIARPK